MRVVIGLVCVILALACVVAQAIDSEGREDQIVTMHASITRTISYQGILKNGAGNPVSDNTYNVTFRIYNGASGGSSLWSSPSIPVTTVDGIFVTEIGPITLAFDTTYYLSLQVSPDPEMVQRQMLTMSAYSAVSDTANYAFKADTANHVPDNSITSAKIVNGTIQFGDIGQNSATNGQVMKWNGSAWVARNDSVGGGGSSYWTLSGNILSTNDYWAINKGATGNALYGSNAKSMVNLGVACTTGTSGQNYSSCTVGGGVHNIAGSPWTTVSGGASNTASADNATVGGGSYNAATEGDATIGGGAVNNATELAATIAGGYTNSANGQFSTIAGGKYNHAGDAAGDTAAVVAGGAYNSALEMYSTIGGGLSNYAGGFATIAGGAYNYANGGASAVGGGTGNSANGSRSVVSGGQSNEATQDFSVIGGGESNTASADHSTVAGGLSNTVSGDGSTVGGGTYNTVSGGSATVSGGAVNNAGANHSTVGGGLNNTASDPGATIAGGARNAASGFCAAIGGGDSDTANGTLATISGGYHNKALGDCAGVSSGKFNQAGDASEDTAAVIAGGENNRAWASYTTIGGGKNHLTFGPYSNVGGGLHNSSMAELSVIAGGLDNQAQSYLSAIGGGDFNRCSDTAAVVTGGMQNWAYGKYTAIGGGYNNRADEKYDVIAGGQNNYSHGQWCSVSGGRENYCAGQYSSIPGGYGDTLNVNAQNSLAFGRNIYSHEQYHVIFFNSRYPGKLRINRDSYDGSDWAWPIMVGTNTSNGNGAYLSAGGVWTNGSGMLLDTDRQRLDGAELLFKISSLSITSNINHNSFERHIGPSSTDFARAFDVGAIRDDDGKRNDQGLAASDVAGVALAGVQELLKKIETLEKRIAELEAERGR
jgi:hypothetical protein